MTVRLSSIVKSDSQNGKNWKPLSKEGGFLIMVEMEKFSSLPGHFANSYQSYHISPRKINLKNFQKTIDKYPILCYNIYIR